MSSSSGAASRTEALLAAVRADPRACEMQLSLLSAALQSYRRDTVLKPFPPAFVRVWDNGSQQKMFHLVDTAVDKVPPMPTLVERLEDPTYADNNADVIDLLHFLFVELAQSLGTTLAQVPADRVDAVLAKAPSEVEVSRPQFVFELRSAHPDVESRAELKWRALAAGRPTVFAYHGSRLENFHSIVRHGLRQHMNRNGAYGSGTYLSSELGVSLPYSPLGIHWDCSSLGRFLSCVALCEIIDAPRGVLGQRSEEEGERLAHGGILVSENQARGVPHKYYVVSNDDLVRVRYLLVYAKDLSWFMRRQRQNVKKSVFRQWASKNKMLIIMFAYVFILTVIGYSNNNSLYYYYRNLYKKFRLTYL